MIQKMRSSTSIFRLLLIVVFSFWLSACDMLQGFGLGGGGGDEPAEGEAVRGEVAQLTFAAPSRIPWLPWLLAKSEDTFQQYGEEYGVDIEFVTGDYDNVVNQFVSGEVDAAVMMNVDAISHLIRRKIPVDVILISSYSSGNDAILIPNGGDNNLSGQSIALKEHSSQHYLLDRYLLKSQIDFGDITVVNSTEAEIESAFDDGSVSAVATWNPQVEGFMRTKNAKLLFASHQIPHELSHLLVVRREVLEENPGFGKALLATWFTIMERLQGNRRGATLDALAEISEMDRAVFDRQFDNIDMITTPIQAISTLRDRRMRKSMRHIRSFIERYELAGDIPANEWVSYPGRTPELLHFNATPLQEFIAPATEEQ